ncbi:MAG: NYN domain-containing protein [Candidatus Margulisbacteria bacterium]|nr:NYN domain-containing protein [Candidatus Margulisiibacteriota bacterium]
MRKKQRISFFIDGYNLFYGLKSLKKQNYKWLNIKKLSEYLINPNAEEIAIIHYFTTKVIIPADIQELPENIRQPRMTGFKTKQANQEQYLSALRTLPNVNIHYGKYKNKIYQCPKCHQSYAQPTEKITDVNISVQALLGAHNNEYDTAYFITGDTDIAPAMQAVGNSSFNKLVKVAFPPNRKNDYIKNLLPNSYRQIKEKTILKCLFAPKVKTNTGYEIICPQQWQVVTAI